MCVLTYLPQPHQGFIITNNRDENIGRPSAKYPSRYKINGEDVFFPLDGTSKGTWIATNQNFTLCLLNGAFENHISRKPYQYSRGNIIVDFYNSDEKNRFLNSKAFIGFENFTLIVIENKSRKIIQIVWDGEVVSSKILDDKKPFIWSSSTLYSPEIILNRRLIFSDFLKEFPESSADNLVDFHKFGDLGDEANNLIMKRPDGTQTQSISQIISGEAIKFRYLDLLENTDNSILIL